MSGLLQRLASQAMGTGAKVRAAARIRVREPLDVMASDDLRTATPADSERPSVRTATPPELERPSDSRPDQLGPRHSGSTRDDIRAIPGIGESQAAAHAPRHGEPAEASASSIPATTDHAPHRQAPPTDPYDEPRARRRDLAASTLLTEAPRAEESDGRSRVPTALLGPQRPAQAVTTTRPDAVLDRPLPGNRDTEPNEVHVHIGRIEVTAVEAPASPKRSKPTPARKSVSLEDYLAQRHRRAS